MTSASDSNAIQPTVVVGASGASCPLVRVLASAIHITDTITGTTITTELSPADGERARVHRPHENRSHRVGRDRDHLVDVVGRVVRLDAVTGSDVDDQERHQDVVVEDERVVQPPLG